MDVLSNVVATWPYSMLGKLSEKTAAVVVTRSHAADTTFARPLWLFLLHEKDGSMLGHAASTFLKALACGAWTER